MKRKTLFLFISFGCSPSISMNKPPVITSIPIITAKVGAEYTLMYSPLTQMVIV